MAGGFRLVFVDKWSIGKGVRWSTVVLTSGCRKNILLAACRYPQCTEAHSLFPTYFVSVLLSHLICQAILLAYDH